MAYALKKPTRRKLPSPPAPSVVEPPPVVQAPAVVTLRGKQLPVRPEFLAFAKALRDAMADRQMSASDLARAIWGSATDPRGYDVARNRDRIGAYLSGPGYPSRETMPKLCEAVGLDIATLPMPTRSSTPRDFAGTPDVTFTLMTEHPGLCSIYIRKMLPVDVGLQI